MLIYCLSATVRNVRSACLKCALSAAMQDRSLMRHSVTDCSANHSLIKTVSLLDALSHFFIIIIIIIYSLKIGAGQQGRIPGT